MTDNSHGACGTESPMEWQGALRAALDAAEPLRAVRIPLADALGRVLAEAVSSCLDVPPFDNSAMDGFAVRSSDTAGASTTRPAVLRVVGRVAAGAPWGGRVGTGEAAEIMTGAPMPAGSDAVVRVEDTSGFAAAGPEVRVFASACEGDHVRRAGDDTCRGDLLVRRGEPLTPARIGLLASCGIGDVHVHGAPRVALMVVGDEVLNEALPNPESLPPGMIFSANAPMIGSLLAEAGFACDELPPLRDDATAVRDGLAAAFSNDLVITVGGASMGRHDHLRAALTELGAHEVVARVNQQPGGPMVFAQRQRTLFLALPGNPVAAWVCSFVYALPLLRRLAGWLDPHAPRIRVVLGEAVAKGHGKTTFVRAMLARSRSGRATAFPLGGQASHRLRSLAGCHGLIVVPADARSLPAGTEADFLVSDSDAVVRIVGEPPVPEPIS